MIYISISKIDNMLFMNVTCSRLMKNATYTSHVRDTQAATLYYVEWTNGWPFIFYPYTHSHFRSYKRWFLDEDPWLRLLLGDCKESRALTYRRWVRVFSFLFFFRLFSSFMMDWVRNSRNVFECYRDLVWCNSNCLNYDSKL